MRVTTVYAALVILTFGSSEAQRESCFLKGDPHFCSYSGAMKGSVPFPCIFLVTKSKDFPTAPNFKVEVTVFAASGMHTSHNGGYFVDWVQVVVDGFRANGASRGQVTFTADIASVQNAIDNSDISLAWIVTGGFTGGGNTGPPTIYSNVSLLPTTKLQFFNPGQGNGNEWMSVEFTPRITGFNTTYYGLCITLHQAPKPSDDYLFPASLCSTFDDTDWNNNAINIGSHTQNILYALFDQNYNQDAAECIKAFSVFHGDCATPTHKTNAVVSCSFYLERGNAACLEHDATGAALGDAFRAFINCMAEDCDGDTDVDWIALQNRLSDTNC